MKKAPALPFFIHVEDYHEFSGVQSAMQLINPKIKVEEISSVGFTEEEEETLLNPLHPYIGIVFEGKKVPAKTLKAMLADKKRKIYSI